MDSPMNNDEEYIRYMEQNIFTQSDMINKIIKSEKLDNSILKKMDVSDIASAIIIINGLPDETKNTKENKAKIKALISILYVKIKLSPYIYVAFDNNGDFYVNN